MPPKAKGAAPKAALPEPPLEVSKYLERVESGVPFLELKLDNERSGNPRPVNQAHVNGLAADFMSNPPAGELTLTVWTDPGIFIIH